MEIFFHNNPQSIPALNQQNQTPNHSTPLISALDLAARSLSSSSSYPSDETLDTLRSAYALIGSFLSQAETDKIYLQDEDEPMQDGGNEESRIIEEVEEGMRECVLQSKRRKRRVSPSWIAGRAADRGEELLAGNAMDRRRSAIELVFQFHA